MHFARRVVEGPWCVAREQGAGAVVRAYERKCKKMDEQLRERRVVAGPTGAHRTVWGAHEAQRTSFCLELRATNPRV